MMPKKPRCEHPIRRYRSGADATCGRPEGHPGQHSSTEALQRKSAGRGGRIGVHGYASYTRGCRCETCTAAKAAYMKQRRASAYVVDTAPETDPAVTHGTRFAYEERGCRCDACVAAKRRIWRGWSQAKRRRAA